MLMRQRFTVEEVNELIPTLELIMGELLRHAHSVHRAVLATAARLGCDASSVDATMLVREQPQAEASLRVIEEALSRISQLGGQVKGLDLGLVDFPGELNGQEVLLCWQFGEQKLGFYHLPDEGFAGRKPLPEASGGVRTLH